MLNNLILKVIANLHPNSEGPSASSIPLKESSQDKLTVTSWALISIIHMSDYSGLVSKSTRISKIKSSEFSLLMIEMLAHDIIQIIINNVSCQILNRSNDSA